jgi:hypothetical protein
MIQVNKENLKYNDNSEFGSDFIERNKITIDFVKNRMYYNTK